jgi:SAM-dependent methyltransferase
VIRYEFLDLSIQKESIHPESIFKDERELAQIFISQMNIEPKIQACPVCGTSRNEILFEKWGVPYAICIHCWSISLSISPTNREIFKYFHDSKLSRIRASRDFQQQVSKNRSELWERQIGWMEGRIGRYLGNFKYSVIDWGSKYVGWTDFLSKARFVETLDVEEPLPPILRPDREKKKSNIVCLMDVFQRIPHPQKELNNIHRILLPGGLLIATCRAGSGFDILTLRENSESIFPLDHILLPSPKGMEILLEKAGFDVLEITTPGFFDMKYIQKAKANIPKDQYFARYITALKDDHLLERMQGFLQRNNLSSHLRFVAKRRS